MVTVCAVFFNIKKLCTLPTKHIHEFLVNLRISSDYLLNRIKHLVFMVVAARFECGRT